jgi:hypothetical protein
MAILSQSRIRRPEIDLSGPEGNAFVLMGYVSTFGKQLGLTKEEIKGITTRMMEGDYDNLIKIFDDEFGEYVDLVNYTRGED